MAAAPDLVIPATASILGFSHLHLSGAQGKYGNILVAAVTGPLDLEGHKTPRTDEVAKVGYYAANSHSLSGKGRTHQHAVASASTAILFPPRSSRNNN